MPLNITMLEPVSTDRHSLSASNSGELYTIPDHELDLLEMLILDTSPVLAPPKQEQRALKYPENSQSWPLLTVGLSRFDPTVKKVHCACGGFSWMTEKELALRQELRIGCLQDGCMVAPVRFLLRLDNLFSFWMQFVHMLYYYEKSVDFAWGGTLYGDPLPLSEGYCIFEHDIQELIPYPIAQGVPGSRAGAGSWIWSDDLWTRDTVKVTHEMPRYLRKGYPIAVSGGEFVISQLDGYDADEWVINHYRKFREELKKCLTNPSALSLPVMNYLKASMGPPKELK